MNIDKLLYEYRALSEETKKAEKAAREKREKADYLKKSIIELCKDTGFIETETQKATVTEINVKSFTVPARVRYDVKITSNMTENRLVLGNTELKVGDWLNDPFERGQILSIDFDNEEVDVTDGKEGWTLRDEELKSLVFVK